FSPVDLPSRQGEYAVSAAEQTAQSGAHATGSASNRSLLPSVHTRTHNYVLQPLQNRYIVLCTNFHAHYIFPTSSQLHLSYWTDARVQANVRKK
ncbi:hypothetical protein PFISCL1PPCAC_20960, partial [Pristionchus fissidentatus]